MTAANPYRDNLVHRDADDADDQRGGPDHQIFAAATAGVISTHAMDALSRAPLTLVSANRSANVTGRTVRPTPTAGGQELDVRIQPLGTTVKLIVAGPDERSDARAVITSV